MSRSRAAGSHGKRWIFFGLACLCLLMYSLDMTIVAVAFRTIVADLDTSLALAAWTLTGFTVAQCCALPMVGKIGERLGQMRVFIACVFVFTLGSLLCGLAPNIYILILCRVLQALGGAGFMTSATAIVAREFPETRSKMIGLFASIMSMGGVIGPNLGGFIIQNYGWREVFLVNVPIGIVAIPLLIWQSKSSGLLKAPEKKERKPLDFAGSALFGVTMVALLTALTMVGDDENFLWTPWFPGMLGLSVIMGWLFIRQERRAPEPVIELQLVAKHPFLVVNVFNFAFGVCVFAVFTFVPYFASVQYGMGPLDSGAILTPRSIAMILVSACTSIFFIRLGYRVPIVLGMAGMVVSMLVIAQGWNGFSFGGFDVGPFGLLALLTALSGISMGFLMPAANNAILDLLPERVGVVSGLRQFFRQIGGMIGTAFVVVWLSFNEDKAAGMREIYTIMAFLLVLVIPLAFFIPDTARDKRNAANRAAEERATGGVLVATPARVAGGSEDA